MWDRGRPARNAPQARQLIIVALPFSRFALIAGGTPAIQLIPGLRQRVGL